MMPLNVISYLISFTPEQLLGSCQRLQEVACYRVATIFHHVKQEFKLVITSFNESVQRCLDFRRTKITEKLLVST